MRSICFVAYPDGKIVGAVGTEFFPCHSDYKNASGVAVEAAGCSVLPADMTFRNLRAKTLLAGFAAGESATITLRYSTDDGATWSDSALAVTVSDAVIEDSEEAVDVALSAGDLVTWKVVRTGGAVGTDRTVWTCEIDCDAGQPIFGHSRVARSANTELPPNAWRQSSGAAYHFAVGAAGTLRLLRGWVSAAPGDGISWNLDVRGAVDTAWSDTSYAALGFSASIGSSSQVAADTSTTFALARGNAFYFRVSKSGGTPTAAYIAMSAVIEPNAEGLATYSWRYSGDDTVTRFMTAGLGGNQSGNVSESRRQQIVPSDDWTVRDAFLHTQNHSDTPGAGNERGLDFRVDGAAGNVTLLLGGSDVLDEDTTHTDDLVTGSLISWQWTIGTSTLCDNLGSVRVGFVLEDAAPQSGPADVTAASGAGFLGSVRLLARGAVRARGAGEGLAVASARGIGSATASGTELLTGRAAITARGAAGAQARSTLSPTATPSARTEITAGGSVALSATVAFAPAGEIHASGVGTLWAAAGARARASVAAYSVVHVLATAQPTVIGTLSCSNVASVRGAAQPGARVAATATVTASLASRVGVRAMGAVRATSTMALSAGATVTAGVPVDPHHLPGVGVLVAAWHPSLNATWRPQVARTHRPSIDRTRVPFLAGTLDPQLDEAP